MKQEIVRRHGYSHFDMRFKIPFWNKYIRFNIQLYPKTEPVLGMTNRTQDGYYITFLDYDDHELEEVVIELKRLQEDFAIGNFYVFECGKNSFHAICCTQLWASQARNIIMASSADAAFKFAPNWFKRSRWILRIYKKGDRPAPKWVLTVKSKYQDANESPAHLAFLKKYYNIPGVPNIVTDQAVQFAEYDTYSRLRK